MFDIAWSEMLVIGAVALVVIGPKDLPKALRSVGEAVGKIKRMASEFQGQFNDAMREAELHDLKKQVEDVGGSVQAATKVDFNPIETIRNEIKGSTAAATDTPQSGTQPVSLTTDAASAAPLPDPVIPLPEPPPPLDVSAYAPPEPEPAKAPRTRKKAPAAEGGEA
ncbi:MAG: Sec-independent protein translocase protein TatB [Beijerinckiaceae bacterium]|jgi:sec-independent protein translocase protein TatB|nr:Sec-independent protein translocase protein TatB [Beijerinckiaceae bacterium]